MIAVDVDKLKGEIADMKVTIQTPNWDYVTGYISALSVVEGMIATLPTITLDDLRPKGRWIERYGVSEYKYECSVCHLGSDLMTDFCGHCGADMRGGGEDEY